MRAMHIFLWSFSACAPSTLYSPNTEHLLSHSKSLCKNMTRASVGCKQYAPTKLGAHTERSPIFFSMIDVLFQSRLRCSSKVNSRVFSTYKA